jgi:Holliday junction resolvase
MKFIALRVTAEIVVIVQNQNTSGGILLAMEVRCRQATDAAANHDQIKNLAGFDRRGGMLPKGIVALRMSDLERAGMASPHPG